MWEYAPKLSLRQKVTAVLVGALLGLLMAGLNIIFKEYLETWRWISLPVFVSGAIIILGIAYFPRF